MPSGYWITWGGTFEQLQSASRRLTIVVPVALLLVFMLLFAMFGNIKDGLLVFTGVPFASPAASWRCGCATFRFPFRRVSASSPCQAWRC